MLRRVYWRWQPKVEFSPIAEASLRSSELRVQLRALALQQKSRRGFTCRHNPMLGWSWRSDAIRNRRSLECSRFGDFIYARNSVGCSVVYPGARQKRS
jgi:hypothetical protein